MAEKLPLTSTTNEGYEPCFLLQCRKTHLTSKNNLQEHTDAAVSAAHLLAATVPRARVYIILSTFNSCKTFLLLFTYDIILSLLLIMQI